MIFHLKNFWHAGLFLAGLAVHYTSEAKRYMPEALVLYCRIMHAVVPPKAATLLLSSSKAAKSRGKQQSHVQPHSSSAPSSASQPMQQLYVHPLDSLDWPELASDAQNGAASVQPLSLTGCLGGGAADLDMPAFRCAHVRMALSNDFLVGALVLRHLQSCVKALGSAPVPLVIPSRGAPATLHLLIAPQADPDHTASVHCLEHAEVREHSCVCLHSH